MSKKVLAMTLDGRMTYCSAPPDKRGKGRCDHVFHQEDNETVKDFTDRCSVEIERVKDIIIENNLVAKEFKIGRPIPETKIELFTTVFYDEANPASVNNKIGGSQPKTITEDGKYIKQDSIETDKNGRQDPDFSYPSVPEVVCSSLIRNSSVFDRIRCANYYFGIYYDDKYEKHTMSISANYRKFLEVEYKLAGPYGAGKDPGTIMRSEDFREDIMTTVDVKGRKNIVLKAIKDEFKCNEETMKKLESQLEAKCALDILFDNADVTGNPGNFILTENKENGDLNIINMDYGRCLSFGPGDTFITDSQLEGFEPFEIDLKAMKDELKEIRKSTDGLIKRLFIKNEENLIKNLKEHKNLWVDIKGRDIEDYFNL